MSISDSYSSEDNPILRTSDYSLSGVLTFLDEQWRAFQDEKDDLLRERNELKRYISKLEGERSAFEHVENALVARIKMLENALKHERGSPSLAPGDSPSSAPAPSEPPRSTNNILEKYLHQFDSQSKEFMVQVEKDVSSGHLSKPDASSLGRDLENVASPTVPSATGAPSPSSSGGDRLELPRGGRPRGSRTADKPVPRVMTWVSKVKEGDTFSGVLMERDGDDDDGGVGEDAGADGAAGASRAAPKWQQRRKLRHHLGSVRSVCFHQEQAALLSGGDDGLVKLWSLPDPRSSVSRGSRSSSSGITPVVTLRGHVGAVYRVIVDAESEKCFSAGADGSVRVWTLPPLDDEPYQERGRAIVHQYAKMVGHTDAVWDMDVHPTCSKVMSCSADGSLKVWDYEGTSDGEDGTYLLQTIHHPSGDASGSPVSLSFLPWNSEHVAVGYASGEIVTYDVETGSCLSKISPPGSGQRLNTMDVHHHKRILASGYDDGSVRFVDLDSNSILEEHTMKANPESVAKVAFDPQSDCVAIAGHDCSLVFGDCRRLPKDGAFTVVQHTSAHKPPKMHEGILDVAYAPQRRLLASSGSDSIIRVWDSNTS